MAPAEVKRGRKVSMDDAFDDPEFDPFSRDKAKKSENNKIGIWTGIYQTKKKPEPKKVNQLYQKRHP